LPNIDDLLEKYIHFGGLPYLIHLPLEEYVVMEYTRSVYSTIVLRDVIRIGRYDITGKKFFERGEKYYFKNMGIRDVTAGYKLQDRLNGLKTMSVIVCYFVDMIL